MPLIRDTAIVLKRLDFSESSQVLAIFTRSRGKGRVIAKGIRRSTKRRFSPGIDLLEAGEAVLSVRAEGQEALATLTEWKQRQPFSGLRESLQRLHAAQYAVDIVAGMTEDWDPHPLLYDALERALRSLSTDSRVLPVVITLSQQLLHEAGVTPCLEKCVGCSATDFRGDVYFSSFEGGVLCRDCEPARVEKRLVKLSLEVLRDNTFGNDSDLMAAFDLFNYHISHLMGRAPAACEHLL